MKAFSSRDRLITGHLHQSPEGAFLIIAEIIRTSNSLCECFLKHNKGQHTPGVLKAHLVLMCERWRCYVSISTATTQNTYISFIVLLGGQKAKLEVMRKTQEFPSLVSLIHAGNGDLKGGTVGRRGNLILSLYTASSLKVPPRQYEMCSPSNESNKPHKGRGKQLERQSYGRIRRFMRRVQPPLFDCV